MAIDPSGSYWTATAAADIEAYLSALVDEGFAVHAFRVSRCPDCSSELRSVEWLESRHAARHTCMGCGRQQYVADSNDARWTGPARAFACPGCGGEVANVGVGYMLSPARDEVSWIIVGVRCVRCGLLASPADWPVGWKPSLHLLDHP